MSSLLIINIITTDPVHLQLHTFRLDIFDKFDKNIYCLLLKVNLLRSLKPVTFKPGNVVYTQNGLILVKIIHPCDHIVL